MKRLILLTALILPLPAMGQPEPPPELQACIGVTTDLTRAWMSARAEAVALGREVAALKAKPKNE